MSQLDGELAYRAAMKKRIRVVRKAMGLEQAEMGALLGVGQPEISRWENPADKRPKSFDGVREKFFQLKTSLSRFTEIQAVYREINPSKVPQKGSPLLGVLVDIRHFAWQLFPTRDILADGQTIGGEDCFLEGGLAYASCAPWAKSQLLDIPRRTFRYSKKVSASVPCSVPPEAVLADMRTHGREFVLRVREKWMATPPVGVGSGPDSGDPWIQDASIADAQYFSNLILSELESESVLTFDQLSENQPGLLGSKKTSPREFRLAMELLCRVLELCRLDDGKLSLSRLEAVARRSEQYRDERPEVFEMLAEMEKLKSDAVAVLDSVLIGTAKDN